MVEAAVFFLVLWQEDLRLRLRTAGVRLPVVRALQDAWYLRFGDFANGFVNAFLLDGLVDVAIAKGWLRPGASSRFRSPRVRASLAALLSGLSIVLYEVFGHGPAGPDWPDIPAGLLGALFHLGVRLTRIAARHAGPPPAA